MCKYESWQSSFRHPEVMVAVLKALWGHRNLSHRSLQSSCSCLRTEMTQTYLECFRKPSSSSCSPCFLCWCLLLLHLLRISNKHQEEMTLLSLLYNKKTSLINWKWIFKNLCWQKVLQLSISVKSQACLWKMLKLGFYLRQNGKSYSMLQFDFTFVQ